MTPTLPGLSEGTAARQVLRELKRLASDALRIEHDSLIETTSSLTGTPTVLDPVLSAVHRTWIAVAFSVALAAGDNSPRGCV